MARQSSLGDFSPETTEDTYDTADANVAATSGHTDGPTCYAERAAEWNRSRSYVTDADISCPWCRYPSRFFYETAAGLTGCANCGARVGVEMDYWPDPRVSAVEAARFERKCGRTPDA